MTRLMLFPNAVKRQPAIDQWLQAQPDTLRPLAEYWFNFMRALGDDIHELLHDGHPTVCVGEAAFCYVNVFTAHVNVGFFLGAQLPNPDNLLEGNGKFMRHVKLRPDVAIDAAALAALINAAYLDMKTLVQTTRRQS